MIDPSIAKRVIDLRWPDGAGKMARNSIRDEEYVSSHLRLADDGLTHDELIVSLYRALA